MKAYVINLVKDRARMQSARNVLGPLGLDVQRVPAVNGSLLPKQPLMSAGEMGCFYSHLLALETFLQSGDAQGVVFEDDIACSLSPEVFKGHMALAGKHLPNFDIVYLGKCFCECGTFKKVEKNLSSTWGALCLHAYMVSRGGAQKLLKLARKNAPRDPIDLVYYNGSLTGRIKSATFHPSLFTQDPETHQSNLRSTAEAKGNKRECARFKDVVWARSTIRLLRGYWWMGLLLLVLLVWAALWQMFL